MAAWASSDVGTDGIADQSRIAAENMLQQGRHAALLGELLLKRSMITLNYSHAPGLHKSTARRNMALIQKKSHG